MINTRIAILAPCSFYVTDPASDACVMSHCRPSRAYSTQGKCMRQLGHPHAIKIVQQ